MGNNLPWKRSIVIEKSLNFVGGALAHAVLPIVSVGSGNGFLESKIATDLKTNVICVEPKPGDWSSGDDEPGRVYMIPQYKTVQDLMTSQPEIIGKCHLLIVWSSPNQSEYDIDAIRDLKPVTITIIYEETGCAGSYLLHKWIDKNGGHSSTDVGLIREMSEEKYIHVGAHRRSHRTKEDRFINTIALFRRYDIAAVEYALMTADVDVKTHFEGPLPFWLKHGKSDKP